MAHDIVIVGGGIIGSACAFFMARAGLDVALVDQGPLAGGTTANSFAWANASSKTTDRDYHALNMAGVAGYRALEQEFGTGAIGLNATGALYLATPDDAAGLRDLDRQQAALDGFGQPVERLDAAALAAQEPGLTLAAGTTALLAPGDLCVNAPHFARFMAARAADLGALIRENARSFELLLDDAGTIGGVRTADGPIAAPAVLLATGPDTPQTLAALTGFDGFATRFPLRRAPGLLLTTPPLAPAELPRHVINTSLSREFHLLPEFNGGVKLGSDDVDGMIVQDRAPDTLRRAGQKLLERGGELMPALARVDVTDCQLGVGIRPMPEDGKTIFGAVPGADGLYLIATHSGVTLAPVLGRAMVALMTGKPMQPDMGGYWLGRFPGFA